MKITNIEKKENDLYYITQTPNFMEKIFGEKTKIEKYKKMTNYVYARVPHMLVYINQNGKILNYDDKIVTAIEEWSRKF